MQKSKKKLTSFQPISKKQTQNIKGGDGVLIFVMEDFVDGAVLTFIMEDFIDG